MSDIKSLLQQRNIIENRIKELDDESKQTDITPETKQRIETTIGLLMRRKHTKDIQPNLECNHQFGEPDYGYKTCNICGKMKASKHA